MGQPPRHSLSIYQDLKDRSWPVEDWPPEPEGGNPGQVNILGNGGIIIQSVA